MPLRRFEGIESRPLTAPKSFVHTHRLRCCNRMDIRTVRLGENRRTAEAIGAALNLQPVAELLLDAKRAEISTLRRDRPVAMVRDGINDC